MFTNLCCNQNGCSIYGWISDIKEALSNWAISNHISVEIKIEL